MAVTDLTTFDSILKDVYLGPIRDQLNSKDTVYGMLNKKDQLDGRQLVVPIRKGRNFSFGFQSANGTLPVALSQQYDNVNVTPKYYYGTVEITKEVIEQSRSSRGAFARAVRTQLEGLPLDMRDDLDRIVLGNGNGVIGTVTGLSGSDFDLTEVTDVRKFGINQRLTAYNLDTPAGVVQNTGATPMTVTGVSVSSGTATITVDNLTGVANNDLIVKDGARTAGPSGVRNEMMGLNGIIDDANPSMDSSGLQGIDRSSNDFWKSYVDDNGGTNRAITNGLLQSLIDASKIRGNGMIHYFITPYGVRFEYAESQLNVRRNVNTARISGQTTGGFVENEESYDFVEYNNIGFIPDKYAPANTILAVDWDSVWVGRFADFNWLDDDGSILKWSPNRTPSFEAILYFYGELVTTAPNRCAKAEDVIGDDPST